MGKKKRYKAPQYKPKEEIIPDFFNYIYPEDEGLIDEQIDFLLSLMKEDYIRSKIRPILLSYRIKKPNHTIAMNFKKTEYKIPPMKITKGTMKKLKNGGNVPRAFFSNISLKRIVSYIPNEKVAIEISKELKSLYGTPLSDHLSPMDKAMSGRKTNKTHEIKPHSKATFVGLTGGRKSIY